MALPPELKTLSEEIRAMPGRSWGLVGVTVGLVPRPETLDWSSFCSIFVFERVQNRGRLTTT